MAENGDFLLFGDSHHSVKKEKGRVLLFLGYSLHFKFHCCSSQLPSVLTFGNFVVALSQVEWKSLKQNLHFRIQQRLYHRIHSRSEYFFFGQKKKKFVERHISQACNTTHYDILLTTVCINGKFWLKIQYKY